MIVQESALGLEDYAGVLHREKVSESPKWVGKTACEEGEEYLALVGIIWANVYCSLTSSYTINKERTSGK